jgi:hypothetical protein
MESQIPNNDCFVFFSIRSGYNQIVNSTYFSVKYLGSVYRPFDYHRLRRVRYGRARQRLHEVARETYTFIAAQSDTLRRFM